MVAHVLVLCDDDRRGVGGHCLEGDDEFCFLDGWNLGREEGGEDVAVEGRQVGFFLGILTDEVLDDVGVDADDACLFEFAFEELDEVVVELSV